MPPGWSGKVSWGSFGGVLGGLEGLLGSSGLQEQKKGPTSDSLDPPWAPKMEPT